MKKRQPDVGKLQKRAVKMFYRGSKMCAGGKFFRKVNRILTGVFEWRVLAFLVEVWYASVVKERYRKATVRLS